MSDTTRPSEEALVRRRAKKNERNRRYYNNHKEEINAKRMNAYNPDKKREYYYGNHERVLQSQRTHYKLHKKQEKQERLNALLTITGEDEGLKKLIQTHLENLEDIKLSEITALERSILLTVNSPTDPVELNYVV